MANDRDAVPPAPFADDAGKAFAGLTVPHEPPPSLKVDWDSFEENTCWVSTDDGENRLCCWCKGWCFQWLVDDRRLGDKWLWCCVECWHNYWQDRRKPKRTAAVGQDRLL